MPVYPDNPQAFPYTISVIDPRLDLNKGNAHVYGFHVDQTIQLVSLPLADDEWLTFDFDRVYQRSFSSRRWTDLADQTTEPARIETYSEADQERIRQIMNKNAGDT